MAESEAAPPAPSSGPSPIIIAVVVLVIALGGGYALWQFVMLPQLTAVIAKSAASGSGDAAASTPPAPASSGGGGGEPAKGGETAKEFVLNDLLVNLSGGNRYVKCTLVFDADPPVLKDLDDNRAKISDIVQQTIASKKFEDLNSADSRGKLRTELLATINPLLDAKGEVKNIYFQEFIIQ